MMDTFELQTPLIVCPSCGRGMRVTGAGGSFAVCDRCSVSRSLPVIVTREPDYLVPVDPASLTICEACE